MKTFLAVASLLAVALADGNFGAFGGSTGNNLGGYSGGGSSSSGGYSSGGASGNSFGSGFGNSGDSTVINSGFGGSTVGNSGFGSGNVIADGGSAGGKVFRHVSVHIGPEDPEDSQSKVLRIPGGDKHVNIIFVKTPSSSSASKTEVILPEQNQQKNLVYVLLKKPEASDNIRIRRPGPTQPTKPEVYFIRYKNAAGAAGAAGIGGSTSGTSTSSGTGGAVATFGTNTGFSTGVSQPSPAYGSP